jgi:hypothetical protein
MSDNRGPDRSADWPDAATAERLLRGTADTSEAADRRAAALAGLLAAASAPAALDPAREEVAVAAFRAARDEGALAASVRRRSRADDWRPRGLRHVARSAKAVTGTLFATAALGGVAVAAAVGVLPSFGSGASGPTPVHSGDSTQAGATSPGSSASPDGPDRERPAGGASRGVPTPTPSAPTSSEAKALCKAYAADGKGYAQLRSVAGGGGRNQVRLYCSRLLGHDVQGGWWWRQDGNADDTTTGDTGTGESSGTDLDSDSTGNADGNNGGSRDEHTDDSNGQDQSAN